MSKRRKIDYYGSSTLRGDDDIMVGAFDVETDGLGGRLLMVQWGIFGEIKVDSSEHMLDAFFDDILKYPKPVIWFAHFAQYDWRYMMDYFIEHQLDVEIAMRTDTDVYEIRIRLEKGTVIMRDSYALWNSKLEKLAQAFCPEIPKLPFDFETTQFDPHNPEHVEYAKRDVQILMVGLPRLMQKLETHFGVTPNGTFASTSMKGWQYTLPKTEIYNASKFDEKELFIRQGYYGGIVFLTSQRTHSDCETIDLNSSYPAAMMKYGVPYGRMAESLDYHEGKPGMYRCRVRAPENLIVPIIPARDASGAMRWYRGEFDTVCTNAELTFAAQHGYEILDIYDGVVFESVVYPFTPFIQKCMAIRKQFAVAPGMPLTGEEYLAKFMQNSLYGKFGSRRERLRIIPAWCAKDEDLLDSAPYDDSGNWYVKKEIDEDMRCIPHWAAFITAHARLRLLETVYAIGPENVIYGDTDSITMKAGFIDRVDVGAEYGQWKLEKQWDTFRAIAPKVYTGILKGGKFKGAAKGLPSKNLTEQHWKELLEDGRTVASVQSLDSLRVSLKNGVKASELLLRRSSELTNSRNYEVLKNGDVRVKMYA